VATLTEEEWRHLHENFETTDLLRAVDFVDSLRDDLNDGEGCRPPELGNPGAVHLPYDYSHMTRYKAMGAHVSKSRFKAKALEFFRQVETTGEPVVVTDHGQPKLEVRPYRPHTRDPLEVLRGSVLRYDQPTAPVAEADWEVLE
jgi:hypothetical protein